MGGFWSGQRSWKKPVVEGRLAIDAADLRRMGLLVPGATGRTGSLHWHRGGEDKPSSSVSYSLTLGEALATFRLLYQAGQPPESIEYTVRLVTTACHLGGVRWWFLCPLGRCGAACGRRVRKLYLSGKYFGCRRCHNLTYTSSQQSDGRVYALLRGGLDSDRFGDPSSMSARDLMLVLKALTLERFRLDRFDRLSARKQA